MPYKTKGKCVYRKDTGEKVGCTKGNVKDYLTALRINVHSEISKKLDHDILEAKQVGNVYHFTSLSRMFKILQDNALKSSMVTNIQSATQFRYSHGVSTTRDKNYANVRFKQGKSITIGGVDIIFVLDGNKLSERFKTMPFNDNYARKYSDSDYKNNMKEIGDEAEQIWYGPEIEKYGINNIKNYIKKIIIPKRLLRKIEQNSFLDRKYIDQFSSEPLLEPFFSTTTDSESKIFNLIQFIENRYGIAVEMEK